VGPLHRSDVANCRQHSSQVAAGIIAAVAVLSAGGYQPEPDFGDVRFDALESHQVPAHPLRTGHETNPCFCRLKAVHAEVAQLRHDDTPPPPQPSVILAAVAPDSTVVYYHIYDGIVPPAEDKFALSPGDPQLLDDN